MPLGDGSIARAIGKGLKERFPIGGAILEALGPEAIRAISGQHDPDQEKLAERLERAATVDPVLPNNVGVEKWWQSGTTLGMGGSLLTALGALYAAISNGVYDPAILGPLCGTVIASVLGLYRRWTPNLKPLFSRAK